MFSRLAAVAGLALAAGCTTTLTGLNANNELRAHNAELRQALATMAANAHWQQLAADGHVQVANPERHGRVAVGVQFFGEFTDRLVGVTINGDLTYSGVATTQPAVVRPATQPVAP